MSYSPVRIRVARLISEGPEWVEEKDFAALTGYSGSYFHKIVKQLKSTNPKNIESRRNAETHKQRIFIQKKTLLEYLESKTAAPERATEWKLEGDFHKLRGLLEGLQFSENLTLGEIHKALLSAETALDTIKKEKDWAGITLSVCEDIFENLKNRCASFDEMNIFLEKLKPIYLKHVTDECFSYGFCKHDVINITGRLSLEFLAKYNSPQEKEFYFGIFFPNFCEELEKYALSGRELMDAAVRGIAKTADAHKTLISIQKNRNIVLTKILEEMAEKLG